MTRKYKNNAYMPRMNRREFTKGLAALGVAPALPLPSLANAAPVAEMAKDSMYFWAQFITRVHNKCSPAMLTRLLKLDPSHASDLYDEMLRDGVIGPADAFGISKATDPIYQEFAKVGTNKAKQLTLKRKTRSVELPTDDETVDPGPEETQDSQTFNQAGPNSDDEPDPEPNSVIGDPEDPAGRA